jgi:DNA-binding transcriptional MerR regulator
MRVDKAPEAYRTISEVAEDLDLPQHVLRFWETRFAQIKPMKRGGGRRYYRPDDVDLLRGIRVLLYGEGYTIRGVQRIIRESGVKALQALGRGEGPIPTAKPGGPEIVDPSAPLPPDEPIDVTGHVSHVTPPVIAQRSRATPLTPDHLRHSAVQQPPASFTSPERDQNGRVEPSLFSVTEPRPAPSPSAPPPAASATPDMIAPVRAPIALRPLFDPAEDEDDEVGAVEPHVPTAIPPAPAERPQARMAPPVIAAPPEPTYRPGPAAMPPLPSRVDPVIAMPEARSPAPQPQAPGLSVEDVRRLQATLYELGECRKRLDEALGQR